MRVDLFDFDLAPERIALRPATPRESARLLVVDPMKASLDDRRVADLPDLLQAGDLLIANDTKVIKAQLSALRRRGEGEARIGVTLHKRLGPDLWAAFLRPAKRVRVGERLDVSDELSAVIERLDGGDAWLRFDQAGASLDAAIERDGTLPIPPYIASRRPADAADDSDYQTRFAKTAGAVAAPTAGLHVTDDLLTRLTARGVRVETVTLHVGAGTFLPVKSDDTDGHRMHAEWGSVPATVAEAIAETRASGGRIIALGTTSLRILEAATDEDGVTRAFAGDTDIFITPGVAVRSADLLLTNFHLPRSTLFMLVSAFSGLDVMRSAYAHAIAGDYRFFSYGDACLLTNTSRA